MPTTGIELILIGRMKTTEKNSHGGAREGAGNFAKEPMAAITLHVPEWVKEWLKTQPRS